MSDDKKPLKGICTRCQETLEGDQIFHWSPSSWSVWCFQCYKQEHLPNLARINRNLWGACERCNTELVPGGYRQPMKLPDGRKWCRPCVLAVFGERGYRD